MAPQDARQSTSSPLSRPGSSSLSLSFLPPVYILPTHFSNDELFLIEEELGEYDTPVTYDIKEAKLFLGKILQGKRAALELRTKGVWTEPAPLEQGKTEDGPPPQKKRRLSPGSVTKSSTTSQSTSTDDESTESDGEHPLKHKGKQQPGITFALPNLDNRILVVNIDWILKSTTEGRMLPIEPFVVYCGCVISRPPGAVTPVPASKPATYTKAASNTFSSQPLQTVGTSRIQHPPILSPSQVDGSSIPDAGHPFAYNQRRRLGGRNTLPVKTQGPPKLHRTTTSEFEAADDVALPEPPEWVKNHDAYACRRSTYANPPNAAFISELQKIKQARILTLDQIGERAYATSIASIAAYPYAIIHASEILQLPGCDTKIASLWTEWRDTGDTDAERYIPAARKLDQDENLKVLKLFWNIWGVGAETARNFYFTKGWKDIDDIVEFGWNELNRVQQIGVKYYDEFLVGVPRAEVEFISQIILDNARKCRNIPEAAFGTKDDMELIIVGGYRRGKSESGDVDVIVSHRDEEMTKDLVLDIISSLEQEGWITHTLTLHTTTSDRGQQTLPFRGDGAHGHGFDSLDKGLCVWQDPTFKHPTTGGMTTTSAEKAKGAAGFKNPNLHRRVDIIISPWRIVGCAVLGWSGATTFERDIRRWSKKEKFWKFDSSGVRDRATGQVLDLESAGETWEERERLVMEGLGIGWRPPTERCTG